MITIIKQEHWQSAIGYVYNNYHIIYSTKYRREVLTGEIAEAMKEINMKLAEDNVFILRAQEIMPDHVHLFITAHPKWSPSQVVKIMKGGSARMLFLRYPGLRKGLWRGHLWNPSYYVGTVVDIKKEVVEEYIAMQKVKDYRNSEDD